MKNLSLIIIILLTSINISHADEKTDNRINQLEEQVKDLQIKLLQMGNSDDQEETLSSLINDKNQAVNSTNTGGLELDMSVVLDTYYYNDDSEEGVPHLKEEISGFGHHHSDEEHHHSETDTGFNLRHVELGFSAEVDPYFRAYTIVAVDDEQTEIEEAVLQTTSLPYSLTLSAGKMFSGVGRLNRQHSHNWDFYDQPLVYSLLFGPHGLQEKGLQLTWLAPTDKYLLLGIEAFNGDNEQMFTELDDEELPSKDAPRLWTGFVKYSPLSNDNHALQLGASYLTGVHQEAHDENSDSTNDHWLDGRSNTWGLDAVYKYDAPNANGVGDWTVQAEYFNRKKDLEIVQHDLEADAVGLSKIDRQDGYYVQGLYGFAPRMRAGLRWEQVGLKNTIESPEGKSSFDSSSRLTGMLDWKLSEFSLMRFQTGRCEFETEEGSQKAWEFICQWQLTFGKHAAHNF